MKLSRTARLTGLALSSTLLLAACGTDEQRPVASAEDTVDSGITCAEGGLTAAGSSAQKNAVDEWVKAYQGACPGATINYQSAGSGAGIEQFIAGTTAFAGSDSALKDDEVAQAAARCKTGPAINLPMVIGPVAIAYNLDGVDELVLDAPALAKIFSGRITTWDDAALQALNPDASLPSSRIQPFVRSDESGTSDNVQKYLEAAAPAEWTFGDGKKFNGPGNQSAAKSDGVTQAVISTPGAVTYVEGSFAENAGLSVAKISTGASEPVELTGETAGEAVEAATVTGTGNDLSLKLDYATKDEGAYPIVLVTYEIVCEKGTPADQLELLTSFLSFTSSDEGQDLLEDVGYAPLPSSIRKKVEAAVAVLS
ncbi:MAG: pstS [Frankiales bacterium]|nr:pstS [Frankiales bacterium]